MSGPLHRDNPVSWMGAASFFTDSKLVCSGLCDTENPTNRIRAEGTPPGAPNKVAFFKLTDMADVGFWRFATFDRLLTNVRF
jgi:hypothetical protein